MKSFIFIFSIVAIGDAEQATNYYEEIQPGLGKRFAQEFFNSIKRNPFFASTRYDNIRCAQVKKFPYLVHYHIDEKEFSVTILAIYSTYKEPFW